jgi:hypothetical protein
MIFALGEVRNMKEPLGSLLDKQVPIKTAWKLNRLVKVFDKELGDIEEFRVNLIKKLGEEDAEGNVQVAEDKMEEFVKEFNELLGQEIETDFEPIDIDSFGEVSLSARDTMILEKIFA